MVPKGDQIKDYERVAKAIEFINQNWQLQPSLAKIAGAVSLSESHLQRLFRRWAGVSPTQYVGYLTKECLKARLLEGDSVLSASLASGLSGPGRAHDLMVRWESLTPGEVKKQGKGRCLTVGVTVSLFGWVIAAFSDRGLCYMAFAEKDDFPLYLEEVASLWVNASICRDDDIIEELLTPYLRLLAGGAVNPGELSVIMQGSAFQLKVWEALLQVPSGSVVSYASIARTIAQPSAARAVGGAVGANKIAWLIPCHRVLQQSGIPGSYRWGGHRKQVMLAYEISKTTGD